AIDAPAVTPRSGCGGIISLLPTSVLLTSAAGVLNGLDGLVPSGRSPSGSIARCRLVGPAVLPASASWDATTAWPLGPTAMLGKLAEIVLGTSSGSANGPAVPRSIKPKPDSAPAA